MTDSDPGSPRPPADRPAGELGGEASFERLSERVRSSRPVFLWAPTTRCGTTLLQRLITSSGDIVVYGENTFLTQHYPAYLLGLAHQEPTVAEARRRLQAGDLNFWSAGLWPDLEAYRRIALATFFQHLDGYARLAKADGYARWGIKTPAFEPRSAYPLLRSLLPAAQHVFIVRDLEPVLRSARARRWLETPVQFAEMVELWCRNLEEILRLEVGPNVLVLRYEGLVQEPAAGTELLASFLGTGPLDEVIFRHRVNTFAGTSEVGHSPDQYVAPGELTETERAHVRARAAGLRAAAGYGTPARDHLIPQGHPGQQNPAGSPEHAGSPDPDRTQDRA